MPVATKLTMLDSPPHPHPPLSSTTGAAAAAAAGAATDVGGVADGAESSMLTEKSSTPPDNAKSNLSEMPPEIKLWWGCVCVCTPMVQRDDRWAARHRNVAIPEAWVSSIAARC